MSSSEDLLEGALDRLAAAMRADGRDPEDGATSSQLAELAAALRQPLSAPLEILLRWRNGSLLSLTPERNWVLLSASSVASLWSEGDRAIKVFGGDADPETGFVRALAIDPGAPWGELLAFGFDVDDEGNSTWQPSGKTLIALIEKCRDELLSFRNAASRDVEIEAWCKEWLPLPSPTAALLAGFGRGTCIVDQLETPRGQRTTVWVKMADDCWVQGTRMFREPRQDAIFEAVATANSALGLMAVSVWRCSDCQVTESLERGGLLSQGALRINPRGRR